jgi:hypothetical protein
MIDPILILYKTQSTSQEIEREVFFGGKDDIGAGVGVGACARVRV